MNPRPIFLLCPARSYSTVTTALLGGHPQLLALPEMLIYTVGTIGEFLSQQASEHRPEFAIRRSISGPVRAVAKVHSGNQSAAAIDLAFQWLIARSHWKMTRLMGYIIERAWPRLVVEKSPETSSSDARLSSCLADFPDARFIHLTRHPVTTQRSMHNHWSFVYRDQPRVTMMADCASRWYKAHQRIARTLRDLPADQWMRVRAEDLLSDPFNALPPLLSWLGLAADDDIIRRMLRTEQWDFAGTGPNGELYGGDAKFMYSPALRHVPAPDAVRFDEDWNFPEEMVGRMTALAEYLGY